MERTEVHLWEDLTEDLDVGRVGHEGGDVGHNVFCAESLKYLVSFLEDQLGV